MDIYTINVLDHGYVRLIDSMGDDLTIVNTARVSFDKQTSIMTTKDQKLLEYLIKNRHDSCLRHCVMTFEVYAPLMVKNQWIKHAVASTHWEEQNGWNESSRRYIAEDEEFYVPDTFLAAPDNKKQGAAGPVDYETNQKFRTGLFNMQKLAVRVYHQAIDEGIAPEEARLFLPAYGLYVRWRWTISLNGLFNFLDLRLDGHAQSQIRAYAAAVEQFVQQQYPLAYTAWKEYRQ